MSWRSLRSDELDYEKIWLAVGLGACAIGGAWLALDFPRPVCNFRALTGWPCPTCGTTRAVIALSHHDVVSALRWNPLITVLAGFCAVYVVYAAVVVTLRLPRWRPAAPDPPWPNVLRVVAVTLLLLNWAYLVWARV